jgi:hypothetical protein
VAFAARFPAWCREAGIPAAIDVLFIDTSHLYEHTRQEIAAWFPFLAARGTAIFHDTNMGALYRRADGTLGRGWDNERGVIRAIEEFLGTRYDESCPFVDLRGEWIVSHDPLCNGLTTLNRLRPPSPS